MNTVNMDICHTKGKPPRMYVRVYSNHPRKSLKGYVRRSILVVEKAIGKFIDRCYPIHHVDGNTLNDSNNNLVVCENLGYHELIEKRKRAFDVCGHTDWRKCKFCKEFDDPKNMYVNKRNSWHRECRNKNIKADTDNLIIKRRG